MAQTNVPWCPVGAVKVRKLALLGGFLLTNTSELLLPVSSNHCFSGFLVLQVWGKLRVRECQGELKRCNDLKVLKLVTIYEAASHSFLL